MDSVLKQNDIKNSLKKEFKLIKVEIDNQSKLPDSSMRTNKTPTLYFVKNGRQIHRPINAVDANHFREILKELR
jgi:thioredoxin-like negative regulator of GroEL